MINITGIRLQGRMNLSSQPDYNYWLATVSDAANVGITTSANQIAQDVNGNIYFASKSDNTTAQLTKISATGTHVWTRAVTTGTTDYYVPSGVVVDSSGNTYYLGTMRTSTFSSGYVALFKYNTTGSIVWQRRLAATGLVQGLSLSFTNSGNLIIGGETTSSSFGLNDLAYFVFDTSGNLLSQKKIGTSGSELGLNAKTDSSGNILCVGYGTAFGPGSDSACVVKLPSTGASITWQKYVGGTSTDRYGDLTTDSVNNIYCVGYTASTGTLGGLDALIVKHAAATGAITWQRRIGTTGNDYLRQVVYADDGFLYAVGTTSSVDPVTTVIIKMNIDGTVIWQRVFSKSGENTAPVGMSVSGGKILLNMTSSSAGMVLLQVPTDGTLTGTYNGFVYAAGALTVATSTIASANTSFSVASVSYTATATAYTATSLTPTILVTDI